MALLQGLAQKAATAASWELSKLAAAAGLPQPPPIVLPPIPSGTPDPAALVDLIGPEAASVLATALSAPGVLTQMQADLEATRDRVNSYVESLTTLESRLLTELAGASAEVTALQNAAAQAATPLGVLGEGGPSPGLLTDLAALAPDLAAILTTLQTGQTDALRRLTAAQSLVSELQGKLTDLASLKAAAEATLDELITRLNGLEAKFAVALEVLT